ncbi:MAG: regulatory protein TetR [Solirubrobacterales bacterium]|nr:regulatory protein TetR [Solirubrobacterales bacterium]
MALSGRTEAQSEKRAGIEAAVLRATEELLADGRPFADLRVEQIATRAGISRTAFYFYFSDKRELLMRLTEGVSELVYAEAGRWWSTGRPGELSEAMDTVIALYDEHRPLVGAVVEASTYDAEVAAFWRAVVGRFVEATQARIEAEQAAGRARPEISARAVAFALTWMTERTCYEHTEQGKPFPRDELHAALMGIWFGAVYGGAPPTALE